MKGAERSTLKYSIARSCEAKEQTVLSRVLLPMSIPPESRNVAILRLREIFIALRHRIARIAYILEDSSMVPCIMIMLIFFVSNLYAGMSIKFTTHMYTQR